jgi:hypothetical protein
MATQFSDGEPITVDLYGPLACIQRGEQQCVTDLRDMKRFGQLRSTATGIGYDAILVSEWRQWFGLERDPEDQYQNRLRSVNIDTGETCFVSEPVSFTWSIVQMAGSESVGLIHEKKGLMELDRRTGKVVGNRPECRDYHCVDPVGVAIIQRGRLNVSLEIHGRTQRLDIKAMRAFLDLERARLPRPAYLGSEYLDLGAKRPLSLHCPALAGSIVAMYAERSLVGFATETGEFVFSISPLGGHTLAYHPARGTLISMGWDDLDGDLGHRVLMEIDISTQKVIWSRPTSCVSPDGKRDPAGFLGDHGRFALLPDNTILEVGTEIDRNVARRSS